MTHEEAVLVSAYTGFLLVDDFSGVHKLIEETLKRPVCTHELAREDVHKQIRDALKPKLRSIIRE